VFTATPLISWTPTEPGATFRHRVDTLPWTDTPDTHHTPTLVSGTHAFEVRQLDSAGNESQSSLCAFEVDLLPSGAAAIFEFTGDAADQGGSGHDADVYGADLTADRHGNADQAYAFDGNDSILLPPADILSGADSLTVSLWLWIADSANAATIMRANGFDMAVTDFRSVTTQVPPGVSYTAIGRGGPQGTSVNTPLSEWVHVAAVFDGAEITLYANGTPSAPQPAAVDMAFGGANVVIGSSQFHGAIDDVRIYPRPLSAAEVSALAAD
jgi:hypothetical protein